VLTGSFLLRLLSFPKYDLIPKSILTGLESKAPAFYKWTNVVLKEKSVNHIYDEEVVAGGAKARFAKLVAEKSAAK
jgi:glutathione S-transferase